MTKKYVVSMYVQINLQDKPYNYYYYFRSLGQMLNFLESSLVSITLSVNISDETHLNRKSDTFKTTGYYNWWTATDTQPNAVIKI